MYFKNETFALRAELLQHLHCMPCLPAKTYYTYISKLYFNQQTVYEYVLAVKEAMTDAFKEISNFAINDGPGIGQFMYCCEQRIKAHKEVWFLLCSNVAVS